VILNETMMKKLVHIILLFVIAVNLAAQDDPVKIFIRGTGLNRNATRILEIGDQTIYKTGGRGLRLTIIDKSNISVLFDQTYDCYGVTSDSESLADKLNTIAKNQIGVLTSYDAWEGRVTDNLDNAFLRLGLTIAMGTQNGSSRRPYAAIFEGASEEEMTSKAIEVSYNRTSNMPFAEIRGFLIGGSFVASGSQSNALFYPQGDGVGVITDYRGFVGVGTTKPTTKLHVAGTITAKEIKVTAQTADFVFEEDYPLRDLNQIEEFIKEHKHLPDIPSAAEMEAVGLNLAEMNKLLLQKIEELTLYSIEQANDLSQKEEDISSLRKEAKIRDLKMKDNNEKMSELLKRIEQIESQLHQ